MTTKFQHNYRKALTASFSPEIARLLDMTYQKRRWSMIIAKEENIQKRRQERHNAACIIAFGGDSTLPAVIASIVASYIPKPMHYEAIQQISHFSYKMKKWARLKNGPPGARGQGGVLHMPLALHSNYEAWLMKNQQPRLRFSQPEFRAEIRNKAHLFLYRRLNLRGSIEEKLSNFFLLLLYKY